MKNKEGVMKKKKGVFPVCPNCKAPNPDKSTICSNCKASLRKGRKGNKIKKKRKFTINQ